VSQSGVERDHCLTSYSPHNTNKITCSLNYHRVLYAGKECSFESWEFRVLMTELINLLLTHSGNDWCLYRIIEIITALHCKCLQADQHNHTPLLKSLSCVDMQLLLQISQITHQSAMHRLHEAFNSLFHTIHSNSAQRNVCMLDQNKHSYCCSLPDDSDAVFEEVTDNHCSAGTSSCLRTL